MCSLYSTIVLYVNYVSEIWNPKTTFRQTSRPVYLVIFTSHLVNFFTARQSSGKRRADQRVLTGRGRKWGSNRLSEILHFVPNSSPHRSFSFLRKFMQASQICRGKAYMKCLEAGNLRMRKHGDWLLVIGYGRYGLKTNPAVSQPSVAVIIWKHFKVWNICPWHHCAALCTEVGKDLPLLVGFFPGLTLQPPALPGQM